MPPQLVVPELVEAGARVYITKEKRKKKGNDIIHSKIIKGTSKTIETSRDNRKQNYHIVKYTM